MYERDPEAQLFMERLKIKLNPSFKRVVLEKGTPAAVLRTIMPAYADKRKFDAAVDSRPSVSRKIAPMPKWVAQKAIAARTWVKKASSNAKQFDHPREVTVTSLVFNYS